MKPLLYEYSVYADFLDDTEFRKHVFRLWPEVVARIFEDLIGVGFREPDFKHLVYTPEIRGEEVFITMFWKGRKLGVCSVTAFNDAKQYPVLQYRFTSQPTKREKQSKHNRNT